MLNVRNLIVDAYKMIGDISDGEALDGTRSTVGLQLLNDIISEMNLENFFASMIDTVTYAPTASQYDYTIGRTSASYPTVDIDIDRPSNLLRVYTSFNPTGTVSNEITLVAPQDLMMFRTDSVSLPTYAAYVSNYPQSKLSLNVKMDTNYSLILHYAKDIQPVQFNDEIEIAPEYEPSLKYALSYLLSERYGKDIEIKSGMKDLRNTAYDKIRTNTQAKTPLMAHMQNNTSSNTIFHMDGWR